jgi:hypothetical protein
MKYIFALFFSAILFIGCGDKNNNDTAAAAEGNKFDYDTTEIKTEPIDNPGEQFQISYKFNQNTPYNYRITMISDVNQQTTMDTVINMNVKQSAIYLLQLTSKETDSDGNTELNCIFSSARIDMEGNGRKVTYQSDSVTTADEKRDYAEHHALINNPFSVRLSSNGEILEIFKVDKIANTYLEYRELKDSVTSEDKISLRTQISETMLKPLLANIFRKVPDNILAKDSTWVNKQPSRQVMVFKLDQSSMFTVKQLEKYRNQKVAVIDIGLRTDVTGESKVADQGVNYSFVKPKISAAGTIFFNIDEGFLQRAKTETHYETMVTAEAGGMKQTNREIVKSTNLVEKI